MALRVATGLEKTAPGHYVKMVHNGIEYGDMQLIGEAYQLMKDGLGLTADELAEVFAEWNKGELDSFLIDISATIFAKKDDDGQPMITRFSTPPGRRELASGQRSRPLIWASP